MKKKKLKTHNYLLIRRRRSNYMYVEVTGNRDKAVH